MLPWARRHASRRLSGRLALLKCPNCSGTKCLGKRPSGTFRNRLLLVRAPLGEAHHDWKGHPGGRGFLQLQTGQDFTLDRGIQGRVTG